MSVDVLVIGAGYTGLSAAYHLHKKKIKLIVLEASSRVGGRTLDHVVYDNMRLELGGQYISPKQKHVTALVKELGLETFPAWTQGDHFFFLHHQIARYQSSPTECLTKQLHQDPAIQLEIESALKKLDEMFATVPTSTPWTCQWAEKWDGMTFQTWLENNLQTDLAKLFFRFMTNQGFSTEPEQISLLQMLWFFKTSHGLPSWAIGGRQANRVVGGTQLVAERLAKLMLPHVRYQEEVLEVKQESEKVLVRTQNQRYQAKSVLICIPPQRLTSLHYTPALPPDLFRAFAAFQTGNSMKVQAIYKKPFWREKGLSGNGIAFNGVPAFTFDNSDPEGTPGVLLGFLTARHASKWNNQSKEERKKAILHTWEQVFGSEVLNPLDYIEMDWMQQPFIRGGHGCHFPPGVWSELGPALGGESLPNFGRIVWAASDLSKDWNGYLEGALLAGEQAAKEIETKFNREK